MRKSDTPIDRSGSRLGLIIMLTCGLAVAALGASIVNAAPGTIEFDPPLTGGAPDGYRLYVDGDLVGPIQSGHVLQFPEAGEVVIGVEAYNAAGVSLVEQRVEISPSAPGPVHNLRIEVQCDGRCSVVITPI